MEWLVYEVVDPRDESIIYLDYDVLEYVERLARYPVVESTSPYSERISEVLNSGFIPVLRVLEQGLTEELARELVGVLGGPLATV